MNNNLDKPPFCSYFRAGYQLVRRLLKVNMDKRGEQEGTGKQRTQIITKEDTDNYQVDYVPLQKCHELTRSTVFFLRCAQ